MMLAVDKVGPSMRVVFDEPAAAVLLGVVPALSLSSAGGAASLVDIDSTDSGSNVPLILFNMTR
jgi:hypothetical protein